MLKIKVVFLICLSIFFWVIYQADTGQNKVVFNVIEKVEYGDKYVHFLFYGFLSFLLNLILKFRQFNLSALNLRAVTLYGCLLFNHQLKTCFIKFLEILDKIAPNHKIYDKKP